MAGWLWQQGTSRQSRRTVASACARRIDSSARTIAVAKRKEEGKKTRNKISRNVRHNAHQPSQTTKTRLLNLGPLSILFSQAHAYMGPFTQHSGPLQGWPSTAMTRYTLHWRAKTPPIPSESHAHGGAEPVASSHKQATNAQVATESRRKGWVDLVLCRFRAAGGWTNGATRPLGPFAKRSSSCGDQRLLWLSQPVLRRAAQLRTGRRGKREMKDRQTSMMSADEAPLIGRAGARRGAVVKLAREGESVFSSMVQQGSDSGSYMSCRCGS